MPRSTAAVAIKLPIAAMSSVPSITMTPTSPGFASSIISTECFVDSVGVAWSAGAGLASAVTARPTTFEPVIRAMS